MFNWWNSWFRAAPVHTHTFNFMDTVYFMWRGKPLRCCCGNTGRSWSQLFLFFNVMHGTITCNLSLHSCCHFLHYCWRHVPSMYKMSACVVYGWVWVLVFALSGSSVCMHVCVLAEEVVWLMTDDKWQHQEQITLQEFFVLENSGGEHSETPCWPDTHCSLCPVCFLCLAVSLPLSLSLSNISSVAPLSFSLVWSVIEEGPRATCSLWAVHRSWRQPVAVVPPFTSDLEGGCFCCFSFSSVLYRGEREKLKREGWICYQVALALVVPELQSFASTLVSLFREMPVGCVCVWMWCVSGEGWLCFIKGEQIWKDKMLAGGRWCSFSYFNISEFTNFIISLSLICKVRLMILINIYFFKKINSRRAKP